MTGRSTLLLDVRPGERIDLGEGLALIEVIHKSGRVGRLRLTAPREVRVRKSAMTEAHIKHDEVETES